MRGNGRGIFSTVNDGNANAMKNCSPKFYLFIEIRFSDSKMKGSAKLEFANVANNCFAVVSWPLSTISSELKVLIILTFGHKLNAILNGNSIN